MKLPRLQNLYWYACVFMAAGFLILGSILIYHSLSEVRRLSGSATQLERFAASVALANAASAERGPAISALRAAPADQAGHVQRLHTLRSQTDERLQHLEHTLADVIEHDESLADPLQRVRLELFAARQETDQWLALSHHVRQRANLSPTIDNLFVAADFAMRLRDALGAHLIAHDPSLNGGIMLSIISSNVREYAARAGFYVANLLGDPDPMNRPSWRKLLETQGRLKSLGRLLQNYGQSLPADSPILGHLQQMQTEYFDEALPWAEKLVMQEQGRLEPMPAAAFTARYQPTLKPLEALRTAIEDDIFQRIRNLRAKAFQTLIVATAITLVITAIFLYINWMLRVGLFIPLLTAKRQIIALANDDLREPRSQPTRHSYELQQMFDGIAALRASQKRKQMLEYTQKKMAEQLRHLSETDPLTGLYNRRALELVAQAMILPGQQQRQSIGLILFDIDHFKEINDTYGHAVGDQVLQKASAQLMPLIRPGDIFARFGGEEFIVLMPDVFEPEAEQMAEKLRQALADGLFVDDDATRPLTASFGVAAASTDECDWDALVSEADQRMYFSKRRGRNQVTGASNARDDNARSTPTRHRHG